MKMLNNINQISGLSCFRKKRAQVGGTLTWFVATIIIIVILLIAIYGSSFLGKSKSVTDTDKEKIKGEGAEDWEDVKNEIAFEKNSTNKDKIQKWLNNKTLEENS